MFKRFRGRPPAQGLKPSSDERKKKAAQANDEALKRLQEALEKLGPMKDVGDLLGKN